MERTPGSARAEDEDSHGPGRHLSTEERLEADVDTAARALAAGHERGEGVEELRALRQRLLNASDRLRRFREERD